MQTDDSDSVSSYAPAHARVSGLFIVFEGIEGSGKSTQARLLAERLERAGVAHLLTREPGGTRLGEQIRQIVLHGEDLPGESELLLMLAARAAHVQQVVRPALSRGEVVVCDRYELSTFAYQGFGRGFELEEVKRLNAFATAGLRPDVTILIDLPVAMGESRRAKSRSKGDRIERAGSAFHERVAEAYRLLASQDERVVTVDGMNAPEAVSGAVIKALAERFGETFGRSEG